MPVLAEGSMDLPRRTKSPRQVGAAPTRRPEIDVLPIVAMLLVFTVHTAEPFNPWDAWHVQSQERSKWLGELVLF